MTNHWHTDHGSLFPQTLALKCDVPGCPNRLDMIRPVLGTSEETTATQALRAEAEHTGWYVARDRGSVNQSWDLCPEHAGAASVRNVGRMR